MPCRILLKYHITWVVLWKAVYMFVASNLKTSKTVLWDKKKKTKPNQKCCSDLIFRWCYQKKWTSWWSGPVRDLWSEWTETNSGASWRHLPGTTQWLWCSLLFSLTDSVLCASMSSFSPKLELESHLMLCRTLSLRTGLHFDTGGRNIRGQVTVGLSLQFNVWEYVCNVFVRKRNPQFYLPPKIIPALQKQFTLEKDTVNAQLSCCKLLDKCL